MDVGFLFPLWSSWVLENCMDSSLTVYCVMIFQWENWWGSERWDYKLPFDENCWLNAPETPRGYIFRKQTLFRLCTEEVWHLCRFICCFACKLQLLEDLILAKYAYSCVKEVICVMHFSRVDNSIAPTPWLHWAGMRHIQSGTLTGSLTRLLFCVLLF